MSEWNGKTALVTGASYGIGEAFAHALARAGAHLVVTARSRDRLETLAEELRRRYNIRVDVLAADLAQPSAPEEIFQETERRGLQIDLLINNAGFGAVGDFAFLPLARQLEMMQVNVTALVALAHLYLPAMLKRRAGAIINVGSTASFQGVPYFAIYSATKSFILTFSEALWAECEPYGVRVLALCPGPVATHFQEVAGTVHRRRLEKMQAPEEVVDEALRALARGRSFVVSGTGNKLMVFVERFAPRQTVTRLAAKLFKPFALQEK